MSWIPLVLMFGGGVLCGVFIMCAFALSGSADEKSKPPYGLRVYAKTGEEILRVGAGNTVYVRQHPELVVVPAGAPFPPVEQQL